MAKKDARKQPVDERLDVPPMSKMQKGVLLGALLIIVVFVISVIMS
ncbi:hypothetical protein [Slackia heliotrinireducens]|uniref:Uncharacterized protein n=1 Tax=Slackia heliotrinireducens (strain ATCC 29202 / DSM 20476 / NCTC 11029 / RHS 1) TaxID=471855 RepID=C7N6L6_SLAHD|nr:hypothetical protein [Slackia heliotrinireducens]ACV22551.1 hypothetical protein Shel_15310 [Slackia heliotrinireducens DSM 20476]